MAKTFYPSFKRDVHRLSLFLARRAPAMSLRCNLATGSDAKGVPYATALQNLIDAVSEIETYWPPYVEEQ